MVTTIEERVGEVTLRLPTSNEVEIEAEGGFHEALTFRCLTWIGDDLDEIADKLGVSVVALGSWTNQERTKLTETSKYLLMAAMLNVRLPSGELDMNTTNLGLQELIADEGSCTVEHLQHLAGVKRPEKGKTISGRGKQWAMLELTLWAAIGYKLERFCSPEWRYRKISRFANLPKTKFRSVRTGFWRNPNPMLVVGVYLPADYKEVNWPDPESEMVNITELANRVSKPMLGASPTNGSEPAKAEPVEEVRPGDTPEWDVARKGPNPYKDFVPRKGQARSMEMVRWKASRKRAGL